MCIRDRSCTLRLLLCGSWRVRPWPWAHQRPLRGPPGVSRGPARRSSGAHSEHPVVLPGARRLGPPGAHQGFPRGPGAPGTPPGACRGLAR
eukprot:11055242-Alexandrium_andersonii.AAC.1